MNVGLKNQIAIAVAAAIGASAMAAMPTVATAKTPGQYVAGDVHNHTTCSDGSISMQKLVRKSTGKADGEWGLDWFVQAGHGGSGNRNCTLVEDADARDASLSAADRPDAVQHGYRLQPADAVHRSDHFLGGNSIGAANLKGLNGGVGGNGNMWRWQSIQEYQYPVSWNTSRSPRARRCSSVSKTNNPGHEHTSMSVIDGQMPRSLDSVTLPTTDAGLQPAGQCEPARAVGILLRPQRPGHEPRRAEPVGLLGSGQRELAGSSELECGRCRS